MFGKKPLRLKALPIIGIILIMLGFGILYSLYDQSSPTGLATANQDDVPIFLNQDIIKGYNVKMDMEDIDGVFWYLFSKLDSEVFVYPTENYYYFVFLANGREFWGNFRLPVEERDKGLLSFAYWEFNPKKSYAYLGLSNWFELSSERAHGEKQENRWLINPHMGYTYVRNRWNYNVETKYLVPYLDTKPNVVDYKGIGGKGAVGIYFTFTRKF